MSAFLANLNETKARKHESNVQTPAKVSEFRRVNLSTDRTANLALLPPAEAASGFDMTDCLLSSRAELSQLDSFLLRDVEKVLCCVSPPKFLLPAETKPIAVFGIISSRPTHKRGANGSEYAHFALTDLRYEIDVFAFGRKLEDILSLRPGTVIAIASPSMTISKSAKARLPVSLAVTKAHKSVLLMGMSKHFGRCRHLGDKTKRCPNWVDTRRNRYCQFHLEKQTFVASGHRPEFNSTVTRMYEPRANGSSFARIRGGRVKWLDGLQKDTQKMEAEPGPAAPKSTGVHSSYEDEVIMPKAEQERLYKRHQDHLENERRIRAKLASRTNGYMLKEYDELGNLVVAEEADGGRPGARRCSNDDDDDDGLIIV